MFLFFDSRFAELESEIKDSPEKIVDLYFEQWLWLFEYPQFGASVLYLLSDGKPHSSGDIENIALLDAEKMHFSKDILSDTICSNKFIEMDYSGNFHIVHDYLAYLALRFCKNSPYLTENMRTSIDYYRDEIEGSPSAKSRVEKRNSQYMGRNRKTGKNFSDSFLRFLLFLTLAGPLFISVLMGINSYVSLNYRFVLLPACCCLSTYYIYNICKYFFRSYRFLYLVTALPGMVSMYSCFRFPDWWAVAIGGDLAWLGACMGFAAKPLTRKARSPFLKNCLSFISIGISVALLGLAYLFLRNSVEVDFIPLIDAVFYGVYIVFVFISITAHINVSFMYERLGLTLMRKIK